MPNDKTITTKKTWATKYALKMSELTGKDTSECVEKAEFMWGELDEDERTYVDPERCAEDDNG